MDLWVDNTIGVPYHNGMNGTLPMINPAGFREIRHSVFLDSDAHIYKK